MHIQVNASDCWYPKFTQDDPRYDSEEYSAFETLLFQVDSQFNEKKHTWEILFLDDGICNFFIEPESLKTDAHHGLSLENILGECIWLFILALNIRKSRILT